MTKLNLKNISTRDNLGWYKERVSRPCRSCKNYFEGSTIGYCIVLQTKIKKTDDGYCSWWKKR